MPAIVLSVLHIALEEGFTGDRVAVSVDGTEVFSGEPTTRLQLGLATSFDAPSSSDPVSVQIRLPERGIAEQFAVSIDAEETWIGISVEAGGVSHRVSTTPFGYV